ncbi:MAG TPA: 4-hydroxy-tetrahydrodipicolinate synthase [Sphingobacterium sp.]|nr:4-hydroxy-tetrahydrodipicolinate synthase [Sphingobacterium sp.]
MREIVGAGVALITPFNEDQSIDFDSLANLIDYQIENGMDYLVSLGTTGETATLSDKEKKEIWHFTSEHVAGRVPLVAGIGGNNTMALAKQIADFSVPGYQAVLSVSPYYNKPTQKGIYEHYKAIAQASSLPLILYNVPGRTGSNVAPETTIQLARDFSNIVATKEACGDIVQISKILRDAPEDFAVISGDDSFTLPILASGGIGVISVIANAYPKKVSDLVKYGLGNNISNAQEIHQQLLALIDLCFIESNPCGVKAMLKTLGQGTDQVRLPLVKISDSTRQKIEKAMKELG